MWQGFFHHSKTPIINQTLYFLVILVYWMSLSFLLVFLLMDPKISCVQSFPDFLLLTVEQTQSALVKGRFIPGDPGSLSKVLVLIPGHVFIFYFWSDVVLKILIL